MKYYLVITMLVLLLLGCTSQEKKIEELFQTGQLLQSEQKFQAAIDTFEYLLEKYPDNKYGVQAKFMIAFILSEHLQEYDQAKIILEEFINEYPDDSLADDAKWQLENMGKDLEELPIFQNQDSTPGQDQDSIQDEPIE